VKVVMPAKRETFNGVQGRQDSSLQPRFLEWFAYVRVNAFPFV